MKALILTLVLALSSVGYAQACSKCDCGYDDDGNYIGHQEEE